MHEFEAIGVWWLPDAPERRIAGTLTYTDASGINLSLIGTLGPDRNPMEDKTHKIVLGTTWDRDVGHKLTLSTCTKTSHQVNSLGFQRESYLIGRVLSGGHRASEDLLRFSRAGIGLSGLESWAQGLTGFASAKQPDSNIRVEWSHPEPITGRMGDGRYALGCGLKSTGGGRTRTLEEYVQFNLVFEDHKSLENIESHYAYPLQCLLTLATDHPNSLTSFDVGDEESFESIKVASRRIFSNAAAAQDLLSFQMLFTLQQVIGVDGFFCRWLDLWAKYSDPCIRFFSVIYRPDIYVDLQVSQLLQALVEFHRIKTQCVDVPTDERLRSLINAVPPLEKVFSVESILSIVEAGRKINEADGFHLYLGAQRLVLLMQASLLEELGIPSEQRTSILTNSRRYSLILENAGR